MPAQNVLNWRFWGQNSNLSKMVHNTHFSARSGASRPVRSENAAARHPVGLEARSGATGPAVWQGRPGSSGLAAEARPQKVVWILQF